MVCLALLTRQQRCTTFTPQNTNKQKALLTGVLDAVGGAVDTLPLEQLARLLWAYAQFG